MTQDEIDEIKYGPKSSEHDDPNESGWTAEGALRFYAAGKNYDIVGDRVRILDNGAVASDALKGMSPEYAATKGCSEKPGIERSHFLGNPHLCTVRTEDLDRLERKLETMRLVAQQNGEDLDECREQK